MKVGIVGAGIGGLSAAIALGADHDVTVFEQAPELRAVGAGIVVSANAGRALGRLGVDLADAGRVVTASTLARADGAPLQRLDLAAHADRFGATTAIRRADLHRALVAAMPSSVSIRAGSPVDVVDAATASLVVGGEHHHFDLLVGADGIRSRVRAALPHPGRVISAGQSCWRALVDVTGGSEAVEYLGAGQRVGVVGLRSGTYLYLVETSAPGGLEHLDVAALVERFRSFAAVAPIEAIDAPPRFDQLHELDRPVWGGDRTVLIGDAAHAMTPNLGQGASMAIEDALVLARCLRRDPTGWFADFVADRDPRVRWVQLSARRLGRAFHARSAPARRLRNGALRRTPTFVVQRQTERLLGGGPVAASAAAASRDAGQ